MKMTVDENGVKVGDVFAASWVTASSIRGVPVLLLDKDMTGGNSISNADVAYWKAFGRLPPVDQVALNLAWGFPHATSTVGRRDFDRWLRVAPGQRGRKPKLSYDEALQVKAIPYYEHPTLRALDLDYQTYYRVHKGTAYWWVGDRDLSWPGYSWEIDV